MQRASGESLYNSEEADSRLAMVMPFAASGILKRWWGFGGVKGVEGWVEGGRGVGHETVLPVRVSVRPQTTPG